MTLEQIFWDIVDKIKKRKIRSLKDFKQIIDFHNISQGDFINILKHLWDKNKIRYETIDVLDEHSDKFKGPKIIPDSWWKRNFGPDFIKRVPPKFQYQYSSADKLNHIADKL